MNKIFSSIKYLNSNKIVFCFVIVLVFSFIYLVNSLFPLIYDDWIYSLFQEPGVSNPRKLSSIYDILVSQYNHYFVWGGRSVNHFILQFLLLIDIRIAKLLNSLLYIFFFFLLYKIINKGKKNDVSLFLFLNIFAWLTYHSFSMSVVFLALSANYLWGTCLIFLFIYPYYSFFIKKVSKDSVLKCILFFLWGVVSGWTNENTAMAMIFFIISLLAYLKFYQKIEIPKWAISGLVGACIGCVIMLLAPGNQVRLELLYQIMGLHEFSYFDLLKVRVANLYRAGAIRLSVFTAIYLILFYCYLKKEVLAAVKQDTLFLSLAFFVAGLISFFVLYPVPLFPDSTWIGIHFFLFVGIGILFVNIQFGNLYFKLFKFAICLAILIVFLNYIVKFYNGVVYFSEEMKKRELFVEQEKARGNKNIVFLYRLSFPEGLPFYDPISEYEESWQNRGYSKYYEINTVRIP